MGQACGSVTATKKFFDNDASFRSEARSFVTNLALQRITEQVSQSPSSLNGTKCHH